MGRSGVSQAAKIALLVRTPYWGTPYWLLYEPLGRLAST